MDGGFSAQLELKSPDQVLSGVITCRFPCWDCCLATMLIDRQVCRLLRYLSAILMAPVSPFPSLSHPRVLWHQAYSPSGSNQNRQAMPNSLTAIVRGFRIPMAVLDRFLTANDVYEFAGYAPFYDKLDNASKLLRARVDSHSNGSSSNYSNDSNKTRVFIPYRMDQARSTLAYVAYAWVFVNGQRKIHLSEDLPGTPPEGFAELRDEIMRFAGRSEGAEAEPSRPPTPPMQDGDDELNALFVIIIDERCFSFKEPFIRKVS